MLFIISELLDTIGPPVKAHVMYLLKALGDPLDAAGISAWEESSYKAAMKTHRSYVATACVNSIPFCRFAHSSIPPNKGNLMAMELL